MRFISSKSSMVTVVLFSGKPMGNGQINIRLGINGTIDNLLVEIVRKKGTNNFSNFKMEPSL